MSFVVPKIADTDINSADTFNKPLLAIESALNEINQQLLTSTAKESVVLSGVYVSNDTSVGSLVYLDSSTGVCKPAQALLSGVPGDTGASLESPSARVIGMVISKSGNVATLLVGGRHSSTACANHCLGADAPAGTYYLSSSDPGKAVLDPGKQLRQPVLTYWGNGTFSMSIFYMAHDNHYHTSFALTKGWTADTNGPSGYAYRYNILADDELLRVWPLDADSVCFFNDGVLDTDTFAANGETIWAKDQPTGDVVVFSFFPFAYGASVIRGIKPANSRIKVSTFNGIATLDVDPYVEGDTVASSKAVSGIDGNKLNYTPVVSSVSAGDGIKVTGTNAVTVGLSQLLESPLVATMVNLNGTKQVSDDLYTYIVFPRNVTSSLTISYDVSDSVSRNFAVWFTAKKATATVSISQYWVPMPSADQPTALPTAASASGSVIMNGDTDGMLYYYEASNKVTADGAGRMVATLTVNNTTSADIFLMSAGVKLYAV